MVVADIQDDAGISSAMPEEHIPAEPASFMGVGKCVDLAMKSDAGFNVSGETIAKISFDEVADETAEHKIVIDVGKIGMCEIVHNTPEFDKIETFIPRNSIEDGRFDRKGKTAGVLIAS